MFGLTALELARIQFGFIISAHIIFPVTTIGLASYLTVLEGLWLWKKESAYRDLYHFWSHIFAVNFAMGVVSGIVMAYQFGTNWSYYSAFAGTITGPLLSVDPAGAFEHRCTVVLISQYHHLLTRTGACRRGDVGHAAHAQA
jgi:cytochrome bd ubiquinol oxidase subunit I